MKSRSQVKQKPVQPIPNHVGIISIVFSLIWSFVWIFFFVGSIYEYPKAIQNHRCFVNDGVEVDGKIIQRHAPGGGAYDVKYRYSFMGDMFEGWQRGVPYGFYKLRNQSVKVLLCSKEPSISVLPKFDSEPSVGSFIGVLLITIFLTSLGILCLFTFLRDRMRRNQLDKAGQNVDGRIVGRWINKSPFEGRRYCISYQFIVMCETRTRQVNKIEFNQNIYRKFSVADAIVVRYVPRNPTICEVLSGKEPEKGWSISPSKNGPIIKM